MTTISRKEIFDLLDHFRKEEVRNEKEDIFIKALAAEILTLKTYEVEEDG